MKELYMISITPEGTPLTVTSRAIAQKTGKTHRAVLADARKLAKTARGDAFSFSTTTYVDTKGRTFPEFVFPAEAAELLLKRYAGLGRLQYRLQEETALKTIEQVLGVTLVRQFNVLAYRLDGYDHKANVAYEIDEPEHAHKTERDAARQAAITAALGCTFVRVQL
jgi:hypothetical protein